MEARLDRVKTSLRGTLAGDTLGLVYEGLSPERVRRMLGGKSLRQRFFFGKGAPSDDSAHAYLTALALSQCDDDPQRFGALLKRYIRLWFHALPFGIGLATLKSGLKMSIGASSTSVNSAGNGPAMRSAVIGAWFKDDPDQILEFVRRSTELTHSHPLALTGSIIVANLAAGHPPTIPQEWPSDIGDARRGPSGFIVHTVNTVLNIIEESNGDGLRGIELAVNRGGDTDTIAAIVGGILGIGRIPEEVSPVMGWPKWKDVDQFPQTPSYLRILAFHLACYPVVLYLGFRRLVP